jgi:hypothetical protein
MFTSIIRIFSQSVRAVRDGAIDYTLGANKFRFTDRFEMCRGGNDRIEKGFDVI